MEWNLKNNCYYADYYVETTLSYDEIYQILYDNMRPFDQRLRAESKEETPQQKLARALEFPDANNSQKNSYYDKDEYITLYVNNAEYVGHIRISDHEVALDDWSRHDVIDFGISISNDHPLERKDKEMNPRNTNGRILHIFQYFFTDEEMGNPDVLRRIVEDIMDIRKFGWTPTTRISDAKPVEKTNGTPIQEMKYDQFVRKLSQAIIDELKMHGMLKD